MSVLGEYNKTTILSNIHQDHIKGNPSALLFNTIQRVDNILITLLNIQSLKKHVKDFF